MHGERNLDERIIHPYVWVGLSDNKPPRRTLLYDTFDKICELINSNFSFIDTNLLVRSRKKEYIQARQMLYGILREHYNAPYMYIGKKCDLNHSTIVHAYQAHENDLFTDPAYKKTYNFLKSKHLETHENY